MNIDQKLTAIRDLIQQDVGNRGLARDPERNLINACPDDFAKACASIADHRDPKPMVLTGFLIPTEQPPWPLGIPGVRTPVFSVGPFETDGPLGAISLVRAFRSFGIPMTIYTEFDCYSAIWSGLSSLEIDDEKNISCLANPFFMKSVFQSDSKEVEAKWELPFSHIIALERVGPNYTLESLRSRGSDADVATFTATVPESKRGRCFTMRGRDITDFMSPIHSAFESESRNRKECVTIGIGDGGNEIGMGKIPWDTIRRNIPNGDLIACRVPTNYLIVAGVSNWGAYALAAGVALLRGVELPAELFDPDREREILQVMVDAGPLVDGVTGKQEATVDGLSWDDYIKPLVEIGKIVRS